MAAKSDIEHWQIDATVYHDRVEETRYITDPLKNIRRRPQTVVWHVDKLLGRGSFGEVRLERNKKTQKTRAVKKIATGVALSNSECEEELKTLLEFSKPKYREAAVFVEFLGWFKTDIDVYIAMEYVGLGDLERNIAAHSGKVPESEARDIIQQILSGLEIMHAERFAHRDLKPQNVLVVHGPPKWWVKIADFGLSKRLTENTLYHTMSGTQPYMAPEVLDYLDSETPGAGYTNAVDLWAVGCITYRLVTGAVPFPPGRLLLRYCNDRSLFPSDALNRNGIGSTCLKFIEELLVPHPKNRLSTSQALNSTWITSVFNAAEGLEEPLNAKSITSGLSDLTNSTMTYNTNSHDAFKSWDEDGNGGYGSSYGRTMTTKPPVRPLKAESKHHDRTLLVWSGDVSVQILKGHTGMVYMAVFSHDSALLASASDDKTVRIWRPNTGDCVQILKGHKKAINSTIFSHDSALLASASDDRTVRIWRPNTGDCVQILKGHTGVVYMAVFSHDSALLASASSDDTVRIWRPNTGECIHTLRDHTANLAFSHDSVLLASASDDNTVRIWRPNTGECIHTLRGHVHPITSAVFSHDSALLASASADDTVRIWRPNTGECIQTLEGHANGVSSVAFSHDSALLASASLDNTVRVWRPNTGECIQTLEGLDTYIEMVAFSHDSALLASASFDDTVQIWCPNTGKCIQTLSGHTDLIMWVAFSHDSALLASASLDNTVRIWRPGTGQGAA